MPRTHLSRPLGAGHGSVSKGDRLDAGHRLRVPFPSGHATRDVRQQACVVERRLDPLLTPLTAGARVRAASRMKGTMARTAPTPRLAVTSFASAGHRAIFDVRIFQECAAMPQATDTTTASESSEPAFYRLSDVIRITALSRSSIYRRIAAG